MTIEGLASEIAKRRAAAAVVGACALFFIASLVLLSRAGTGLERKRAALASFESMAAEYSKAVAAAGPARERLLADGKLSSALDLVQAAAEAAGVKGRIASLKPFEAAPARGFRQSGAEVVLEGVDIGQVVSFFRALERAGGAVVADEMKMKSSFEDPDRMELRARVRLVAKE